MGWAPLDGIDVQRWRCRVTTTEAASVGKVGVIGMDRAEHKCQLHGSAAYGTVLYRRKRRRGKLIEFLTSQRPTRATSFDRMGIIKWG